MILVDLSRTIAGGMDVYPGDPQITVERVQTIENHGWEVRALRLGTHTGTHVDAFSHVTEGKPSIDSVPLDRFFGAAHRVTSTDALPKRTGLLFDPPPTAGDVDAILEADPIFVGSPRLDIEIERPLLDAGIVTFDGLVNLDQLPCDRPVQFFGFPLKIADGDGSPVRAVALID